jgi:hypothetical protein
LNLGGGTAVPAAADSTQVAAPVPSGTLSGAPEQKGGGAADQLKTPVNLMGGGGRTQGSSTPAREAAPSAPAAGKDAVANWMPVVLSGNLTKGEARTVIDDLRSLAPGLSGEKQASAYFLMGMALLKLDENNTDEYCPLLKRAEGRLTNSEANKQLSIVLPNCAP